MKYLSHSIAIIGAILLLPFFISCIEEIEFETEDFESALVIDATFTNVVETQEVFLSRTYAFEEDGPAPERNANVRIIADGQTEINFEETSPGVYQSIFEVAAQPNTEYQLVINTGGREYRSTMETVPTNTPIGSLAVDRRNNDDDQEGVAILVNTVDPTATSNYYRFEVEETFKIIAPRFNPEDIKIIAHPDLRCDSVAFAPRPQEQEICFATQKESEIVVATTTSLAEDRLTNFPVRFINRNNYIISHRYSALVTQFVISREAHTFFNTLNDLSGSGSLFSQTQPGFFAGNISSTTNQDEKVIGFFEVATKSQERIYFNYEDLFPGQPLPPYIIECENIAPQLETLSGCPLRAVVLNGTLRYNGPNLNPGDEEGPYLMVQRVCGDCTAIGNPEPPEFWVEE